MKSGRIESLDSLRGISSMVVVIFHCLLVFPFFQYANYSQEYTNIFWKIIFITPLQSLFAGLPAVLLFFILSGFVLSLPFIKNTAPNYWTYIIKRFCRIYVPYMVIMVISVILVSLFANYKDIESLSPIYNSRWDHPVTLKAMISYVVMISHDMTNVNGVVWTLYHEMRISLFFPFLMIPIIKYNWKKALIVTVGSVIGVWTIFRILIALIDNKYSQLFLYEFSDTLYYSGFFILGAILAKCREPICTKLKTFKSASIFSLLLLALLLINYKWLYEFYNIDDISIFGYFLIRDITPSLGIILLFSLVLAIPNFNRFLTKSPFVWLGKISYSLYLIHIPVIMLSCIYLSKLVPFIAAIFMAPLLSLPVAALTYRFVELPSIELGKRLTRISKQSVLKTMQSN